MRWKKEVLFFTGREFYNSLINAIDNAQNCILFEVYIFDTDRVGSQIFTALDNAATRGVSVKLIVDSVGSFSFLHQYKDHILSSKVHVRVYHPLPNWLMQFAQDKKLFWKLSAHSLTQINKRDHRKICVIDNSLVWLGSFNISECHARKINPWRDTGAMLSGIYVNEITFSFGQIWKKSWVFYGLRNLIRSKNKSPAQIVREAAKNLSIHFPKPKTKKSLKKSNLVLLNTSLPERLELKRKLLARFNTATTRIWITTAYFVPSGSIIKALKQAAEKGIDVKILVPGQSDIVFMPWVSLAFYHGLLKAGVKVYEYNGRVLHAKTIIVDDWHVIGSMNFNNRSLYNDLEINIVLTKSRTCTELDGQFLKDLDSSQILSLKDLASRPWWQKLCAIMLLWFKKFL